MAVHSKALGVRRAVKELTATLDEAQKNNINLENKLAKATKDADKAQAQCKAYAGEIVKLEQQNQKMSIAAAMKIKELEQASVLVVQTLCSLKFRTRAVQGQRGDVEGDVPHQDLVHGVRDQRPRAVLQERTRLLPGVPLEQPAQVRFIHPVLFAMICAPDICRRRAARLLRRCMLGEESRRASWSLMMREFAALVRSCSGTSLSWTSTRQPTRSDSPSSRVLFAQLASQINPYKLAIGTVYYQVTVELIKLHTDASGSSLVSGALAQAC